MKRKFLALLAAVPFLSACRTVHGDVPKDSEEERLRRKFRGLWGVVLRIDVTSTKEWISITSEAGRYIVKPSYLAPGGSANLTFTDNSMPIPKAIRATWRKGAGWDDIKKVWNEGAIIGDYTVPVAERIPDEVLDYIRQHGGALRLKIRLKDDGVLIGWDVEERVPLDTPDAGNYLRWVMPGGDFREAQIYNGKVIDPGW